MLNERLQRPQSARMVALSLLYAAPHDAVFAASGHFLRWLTLAIKRNEERPQPAKRNKAALQAEVQQLQQRLHEMQAEKKDKLDGRGEERQLQTSLSVMMLKLSRINILRFSTSRSSVHLARTQSEPFLDSIGIRRQLHQAALHSSCALVPCERATSSFSQGYVGLGCSCVGRSPPRPDLPTSPRLGGLPPGHQCI